MAILLGKDYDSLLSKIRNRVAPRCVFIYCFRQFA